MSQSSFSVVTTFNKDSYEAYCNKMLLSFDTYWPKEININVYYEDMEKPNGNFSSRIVFHNFNEKVKDWYKFREKFFFKEQNKPDNSVNSFYKYSAIKFAHKVYSIKEQLKNNLSNYLIWLDSDIITFNNFNISFLKNLTSEECYLSYLGRDHIKFHSECGFLIFNTKHKFHKDFWEDMSDMYDNGKLFNEKEWHDDYIFDVVRLDFEKIGCKNFDISKLGLKTTTDILNVFDNSVLGKHMIHFKGNRKLNIS
jgi:hypothetical protein